MATPYVEMVKHDGRWTVDELEAMYEDLLGPEPVHVPAVRVPDAPVCNFLNLCNPEELLGPEPAPAPVPAPVPVHAPVPVPAPAPVPVHAPVPVPVHAPVPALVRKVRVSCKLPITVRARQPVPALPHVHAPVPVPVHAPVRVPVPVPVPATFIVLVHDVTGPKYRRECPLTINNKTHRKFIHVFVDGN